MPRICSKSRATSSVSGVEDAAYYYSSYNAPDVVSTSGNRKVMVLGGGAFAGLPPAAVALAVISVAHSSAQKKTTAPRPLTSPMTAPITTRSGKMIQVLAILADVTEHRRMENELRLLASTDRRYRVLAKRSAAAADNSAQASA